MRVSSRWRPTSASRRRGGAAARRRGGAGWKSAMVLPSGSLSHADLPTGVVSTWSTILDSPNSTRSNCTPRPTSSLTSAATSAHQKRTCVWSARLGDGARRPGASCRPRPRTADGSGSSRSESRSAFRGTARAHLRTTGDRRPPRHSWDRSRVPLPYRAPRCVRATAVRFGSEAGTTARILPPPLYHSLYHFGRKSLQLRVTHSKSKMSCLQRKPCQIDTVWKIAGAYLWSRRSWVESHRSPFEVFTFGVG
jgi:hypothetical protein